MLLVGCGFARWEGWGATSVYRSCLNYRATVSLVSYAVTLKPISLAALQRIAGKLPLAGFGKVKKKEKFTQLTIPVGGLAEIRELENTDPVTIYVRTEITQFAVLQLLFFYGPWSSGQAI